MQEVFYRNSGDPAEIGRKIRECRMKRGMSQDELADRMGLSDRNIIYRHENGKCEMGVCTLIQYAEAMGIDPPELLPNRFSRKHGHEPIEQAVEILGRLNGENLRLIIRLATQLAKAENGGSG